MSDTGPFAERKMAMVVIIERQGGKTYTEVDLASLEPVHVNGLHALLCLLWLMFEEGVS